MGKSGLLLSILIFTLPAFADKLCHVFFLKTHQTVNFSNVARENGIEALALIVRIDEFPLLFHNGKFQIDSAKTSHYAESNQLFFITKERANTPTVKSQFYQLQKRTSSIAKGTGKNTSYKPNPFAIVLLDPSILNAVPFHIDKSHNLIHLQQRKPANIYIHEHDEVVNINQSSGQVALSKALQHINFLQKQSNKNANNGDKYSVAAKLEVNTEDIEGILVPRDFIHLSKIFIEQTMDLNEHHNQIDLKRVIKNGKKLDTDLYNQAVAEESQQSVKHLDLSHLVNYTDYFIKP